MKTIPLLGLILLILALTGCSEKLHELTVDTSNGKTTFSTTKNNKSKSTSSSGVPKSSQYIQKGKALNIKMSNISPNDSLVLSVSEQDVRITGDESTLFPKALEEIKSGGTTSNSFVESEILKEEKILSAFQNENTETRKILEKVKEDQSNYNKSFQAEKTSKTFTQTGLDSLNKVVDSLELTAQNQKIEEENIQEKLDSLYFVSAINYAKNELYRLSESQKLIKNDAQRKVFLALLESSKQICVRQSIDLLKKEADFSILSTELKHRLNLFDALKSEVENLVFEREQAFFPSKEEFTVSIKKYQRNSKTGKAEELVQLTFIQYKRFKIFSSAGMHCMIFDGRHANIYSNKDSMIVRRNGSNIVPSFGTYLNGTWRLNDCLMGIGLGIGIPLQFNSNVDMTPNFNVLWTTNFQNQYGRFGINAGFGIQKVNVLAPGFAVGDNLGNTNPDIPLRAIWTPTFGVGISYNIGSRE
ncbi:hypothetical protein D3C71_801410 [compost metagenome]